MRHPMSPGADRNSPPTMPLMPAILPLNSRNIAVETPISNPSAKEDQGVKFIQSIIFPSLVDIAKLRLKRLHDSQCLFTRDTVKNLFAFASRIDQTFFAQDTELLRKCRLQDAN